MASETLPTLQTAGGRDPGGEDAEAWNGRREGEVPAEQGANSPEAPLAALADAAPTDPAVDSPAARRRWRMAVAGAVQGVGFRPFVYRLARELGLAGWVANDPAGALLEVQGQAATLDLFRQRLGAELPPGAAIHGLVVTTVALDGSAPEFAIHHSDQGGRRTAVVLPDRVTCAECRAEIADPAARRYRYPFTNCTHCGPRFTIVEALPYDRPNTTMRGFALCPDCLREYRDPADRRFHAQPIACPACGPSLLLCTPEGHPLERGEDALAGAVAALVGGDIVAMLGLGGFQLLCDATSEAAVTRLRQRKQRAEKPLAVLVRDLAMARDLAEVSAEEAELMTSAEGPIVLLDRRRHRGVATSRNQVDAAVAPGQPTLGVMLPTTPLHELLATAVGRPLVATSGNLSDEPIAIAVDEGLTRLGRIADRFLVHDRPIVHHVDDSVARHHLGAARLLRRARGHAPFPLPLPAAAADLTVLAVGGHLKNTVGLLVGRQAFLSQHLGDMETAESRRAFTRVVADFLRLYEATPTLVAHDLHPDYATTHWALAHAAEAGLGLLPVQHHHAHLAACLAENGLWDPGAGGLDPSGETLGVTWDGTGYGPDGSIWGGELLVGGAAHYRRVARLRRFRLPGGEAAVREPRRVALALLWELHGPAALDHPAVARLGFATGELALLGQLLARGTAAPWTSSAGRLFDGLAALLGLHPRVSFEGQAAMALEHLAAEAGSAPGSAQRPGRKDGRLAPLGLTTSRGHDGEAPERELLELDWRPLVAALVTARTAGESPATLAAAVHQTLAAAIVRLAAHLAIDRVALTGGCFQNRRLTELTVTALEDAGHRVLLHRQVPPNDGGIAFGQLAVAAARSAIALRP